MENLKEILGLWEQSVCEIRGEIKSWDLNRNTTKYALDLCNKLESSIVAMARGKVQKFPITDD